MGTIQNFYTSRDNNSNAATNVGQLDRLWYDPVTNAIYVSDGTTPGGIPVGAGGSGNGVPGGPTNSVQYNAGSGIFGGTANVTINPTTGNIVVTGNVVGAYLYGDGSNITNLPLANNTSNISGNNITISGNGIFGNISVVSTANLGNLTIYDQTIAGTVSGRDINLVPLGTANVNISDGFNIHASGNLEETPVFAVESTGKVTMLITDVANSTGAVEVIGSTTGVSVTQGNPGVILHLTGADNLPTRMYMDGVNNYPVYIGRRYNGTPSAPTGVLQNQVISRLGSNPYLTDTAAFTPLGVAQINFVATENQTTTAQGSKIVLSVTPTGSNTQATVASFDTSGIVLTGDIIPSINNQYTLGNSTNKWGNVWVGPDSLFLEDAVLGGDAEVHVDNGVFYINGVTATQVGNMQMTTDGLRLTTAGSGQNIQVGENSDTGYMEINMVGIEFRDSTRQTTAAIPLTYLAVANGVATLGSDAKVVPEQLPAGAVFFKGTWYASNNSPTLSDGVGTAGWEYQAIDSGTVDFGAGNIAFVQGDFVIYNGTVWQRIPGSGAGVASFNTRTGVVTLTNGDVTNALSNGSITNNYLNTPYWNLVTGQGIGLTGNAIVELGDSITLTNTGVTAALGGTGVAVSAATGNVTISIGQAVGTGNTVQFQAITSSTTIQATGNITGGNLSTGGKISATGNISTLGYITTPSTTINNGIVTTGNVAASYFIGNGSLLTGINAFGNVYANGTAILATTGSSALTVTPGNNQVITANNTTKVMTIAVNDNPTFGNVTITGNIIAANTSYINNVGNILFANTAPLPTAIPGILEYDGRVLYFTGQDQERGVVPSQEWYVLNADRGLTYASTAPQSLFGVGAHVSNSTRYWFRIKATVSRAAGTNNTALTLGWRGTATPNKITYAVDSSIGAVSTAKPAYMYETTLVSGFTDQLVVTTTSNPPDSTTFLITGMIDVGATGAGYVDPYISWTGATAPGSVTVSALSNFQLYPLGATGQNTSVGNWA